MRFQKTALNNDYYDQDYLSALRFKGMGKEVLAHRSTVFASPEDVIIGSNVTIEPYTVFMAGKIVIDDGVNIGSHVYVSGNVHITKDVPHGTTINGPREIPEEEKPKPAEKSFVWGQEEKSSDRNTAAAEK